MFKYENEIFLQKEENEMFCHNRRYRKYYLDDGENADAWIKMCKKCGKIYSYSNNQTLEDVVLRAGKIFNIISEVQI